MSNRSLVNYNNANTFLGYPISDTPTDNTALFFVNGEFFFATISESGGIIGVLSLGGGASVFKAIAGGILELRSFLGSSNISVQQTTDNISVSLSQFLTGIKKITFSNDINLEEATNDLNFNITDEGASILRNLYFRTKYGVLSSIAMSINNQARIDVYGPMYLNSIADGVPDNNKFLSLDTDGKIIRATVTDATNAVNTPGPNNGWFMGKVGNNLEFRTFKEGLNVNVGIESGQYVFGVDMVLNSIQQINPNTPNSPGATVNIPENDVLRIGSATIHLDNFELGSPHPFLKISGGILQTGPVVESLLNASGAGASVFKNITSAIGYFRTLVAGTNVTLTQGTDTISIDATGGSGVNIFNSNGISTDDQRIFNGKTPGSSLNKFTFNDVNVGFTNNNAYNPVLLTGNPIDCVLASQIGGDYTRFIWSPYNQLSQRVEVPVGAAYGDYCIFYQSTASILTSNVSWIFEVEIYENLPGLSQAFVSSYKFDVNGQSTGAFYIKPEKTSNLSGTGAQNVLGLEAYTTVSGLDPVWVLRLINLSLGLVSTARTYTVFVKDLGKGNKTVNLTLGSGNKVPETNYLYEPTLLYSSVIGFPPSSLVNYRQFGKDLKVTVSGQLTTSTPNQSGTFAILFNGVTIYTINCRSNTNNGTVPIQGSRIFKMISLLSLGALPLSTSFTVSYFMVGTGFNLVNQPFEINIEYV